MCVNPLDSGSFCHSSDRNLVIKKSIEHENSLLCGATFHYEDRMALGFLVVMKSNLSRVEMLRPLSLYSYQDYKSITIEIIHNSHTFPGPRHGENPEIVQTNNLSTS